MVNGCVQLIEQPYWPNQMSGIAYKSDLPCQTQISFAKSQKYTPLCIPLNTLRIKCIYTYAFSIYRVYPPGSVIAYVVTWQSGHRFIDSLPFCHPPVPPVTIWSSPAKLHLHSPQTQSIRSSWKCTDIPNQSILSPSCSVYIVWPWQPGEVNLYLFLP